MVSPSCLVSKGDLFKSIQVWIVCQIQLFKSSAADGLWTDFHVYSKHESILKHQYSTCLFVLGCMRCCMCRENVCENMCVSVVNTHEILKGEDGDVRVMGLAGDVS